MDRLQSIDNCWPSHSPPNTGVEPSPNTWVANCGQTAADSDSHYWQPVKN